MVFPEDLQEMLIRDPGRVVIDLDRLAMIAQVMVSGIFRRSAGITNTGTDDARETPEPGVRAPKSAQGKGGSSR